MRLKPLYDEKFKFHSPLGWDIDTEQYARVISERRRLRTKSEL